MSFHPNTRNLAILIAALGSPLAMTGCTVYSNPDPAIGAEVRYTPLRYRGYVVYYDDGTPYYVEDGRRRYIPRDSAHYHRYRRHYDRYRDGYSRWRREHPPPDRGPRYANPRRHHEPR